MNSLVGFNDSNEPVELYISEIDRNRLKKTSIDYTICNQYDQPLLCIEFDGLQDGYNVGTQYRCDGMSDSWRELIMGLKLRVAHGSLFPYFVVGYHQFKDLAESIQLTIVDGIIGEVLSNFAIRSKIAEGFNPEEIGYSQEDFDQLNPWEQHELVQDWVIGVEVEAEMTHNPISRKACQLWRTLNYPYSLSFLTHPSIEQVTSLRERAKRMEEMALNGCRCTVRSPENSTFHTPISATIWLPNFKTPGCSSLLGLAQDLAKIVALEKARILWGEPLKQS